MTRRQKHESVHPWLTMAMEARPGNWEQVAENKYRLVEKELDLTIGPVNTYLNQMVTLPLVIRRNGRFVDMEIIRKPENIKWLMLSL